MIELRYLVKMVDRPKGIDDSFFLPPLPDKMEVRVMQYREGGYDMIEKTTGKEIWCGSPWTDVPTVEEG